MTRSAERTAPRNTEGFSLVELVIAMIILSVGILGLAGTTMFMIRQVTLARVTSQRSAVYQTVIEQVRALPYDSITSGSDTIGHFRYQYRVASSTGVTQTVRIVVQGPGMKPLVPGTIPSMSNSMVDTFSYSLIRP